MGGGRDVLLYRVIDKLSPNGLNYFPAAPGFIFQYAKSTIEPMSIVVDNLKFISSIFTVNN